MSVPNFSSLACLEVAEKFLWVGWWGGGVGCGGMQSHFQVKPNFGWIVIELTLSWGFDNIKLYSRLGWGCVKVRLGFSQNAYNTRMQLRRTGSSHKRKSCSFHDVTLAEEGSMIKTMNQVRLESKPEVQILQLQCLNFRKQCRMFGRAKLSNKTSWDPSQPASWPTSYRTTTTIWECTRY